MAKIKHVILDESTHEKLRLFLARNKIQTYSEGINYLIEHNKND